MGGRGRSRNNAVNDVFKRIHPFLEDLGASVQARYVESARNPADAPSRGVYPPASLLLPPVQLPDAVRRYLVDWNSPIAPAERDTPRPKPLPKPPSLSAAAIREFNSASERLGGTIADDERFWYDEHDFEL